VRLGRPKSLPLQARSLLQGETVGTLFSEQPG
jgi:hypothetical protein